MSTQVEQGLGIGSGAPFFNRATAALTRFIKLRDPPPGSASPAPTLVLHTRGGHALGDMASYDYFTLGGPFSVRTTALPRVHLDISCHRRRAVASDRKRCSTPASPTLTICAFATLW